MDYHVPYEMDYEMEYMMDRETDYGMTKSSTSEPAGVLDYRNNPIVVDDYSDEDNTFAVELTFSFVEFTDFDGKLLNKKTLVEEWCSKHDASDPFYYLPNVKNCQWFGNTLLLSIEKDDEELSTVADVQHYFRTMSLEDGEYEGDPEDSFWFIPLKFAKNYQRV
jgi:hypothetical protein